MADNCSSLEPWVYRSNFTDGFWTQDAFARDTETLTRALQISISHGSSQDNSLPPTPTIPTPTSFAVKPEHILSASDSESGQLKGTLPGPTRKISKRKSRASKRSPITVIMANPANFRQMVQQVTGVRVEDSSFAVQTVVARPEPRRSDSRVLFPQSCLPTLDTSASFLVNVPLVDTTTTVTRGQPPFMPVVDTGLLDFESLLSFPTLESWSVM